MLPHMIESRLPPADFYCIFSFETLSLLSYRATAILCTVNGVAPIHPTDRLRNLSLVAFQPLCTSGNRQHGNDHTGRCLH